MARRSTARAWAVASALALVACAGQTTGHPPAGADAGLDGGVEGDATACVELTVTPADLACASDSDCTLSVSGDVCPGDDCCATRPINWTGAMRFASMTASFPQNNHCGPCEISASPACVQGQCVRCGAADPGETCDGGLATDASTCTLPLGDAGFSTLAQLPVAQLCAQNAGVGPDPYGPVGQYTCAGWVFVEVIGGVECGADAVYVFNAATGALTAETSACLGACAAATPGFVFPTCEWGPPQWLCADAGTDALGD